MHVRAADVERGRVAAELGSGTASDPPPAGADRLSWMLGYCEALERAARPESQAWRVDESAFRAAAHAAVGAEMPARPAPAAPLYVTVVQAELLFEEIATLCDASRCVARDALDSAGTSPAADMLHALEKLFEQAGALADVALGGSVVGTLTDWTFGERFKEAGHGRPGGPAGAAAGDRDEGGAA